MAHPQTNFNPPFDITRASHLVFTVRDLAASKAFYTEVIGLKVSAEDDSTLCLHGIEERCHHSLTLKTTRGEPCCERAEYGQARGQNAQETNTFAGANRRFRYERADCRYQHR